MNILQLLMAFFSWAFHKSSINNLWMDPMLDGLIRVLAILALLMALYAIYHEHHDQLSPSSKNVPMQPNDRAVYVLLKKIREQPVPPVNPGKLQGQSFPALRQWYLKHHPYLDLLYQDEVDGAFPVKAFEAKWNEVNSRWSLRQHPIIKKY